MNIEFFFRWWNGLAEDNGKLKFRNRREAEEFVRSVANNSGGPNSTMIAMRREYLAIQKQRRINDATGSQSRRCLSIQ